MEEPGDTSPSSLEWLKWLGLLALVGCIVAGIAIGWPFLSKLIPHP